MIGSVLTTPEAEDWVQIVALAGTCSLDRSPGKNWVESSGGLPNYICRIARAIHRSGRPISQSIAIAVSRVKKWAAGGDDVDADTRAKAAKALAEWEKLKAKNKAKKVAASNMVLPSDVIARGFRAASGELYDVSVEDLSSGFCMIRDDCLVLSLHDHEQEFLVKLTFSIHNSAVRFTEAIPVAVTREVPEVIELSETPELVSLTIAEENLSWGGCG